MAVWIGAAGACTRAILGALRRSGVWGLRQRAVELAGSSAVLLVSVAAFGRIGVLILQGSTLYDGVRHVLFVIPMLAIVAARGLTSLLPFLRRLPIVPAALGVAHTAAIVVTLVILHPLEYIAMNSLAGGVAGAYGRFDLDYWSMAAPEALRRLEDRIDAEGRFAGDPSRVLVCLGWREQLASVMFRRNWIAETDPHKADYLIATERWPCADGTTAVLVDEVTRLAARSPRSTPIVAGSASDAKSRRDLAMASTSSPAIRSGAPRPFGLTCPWRDRSPRRAPAA